MLLTNLLEAVETFLSSDLVGEKLSSRVSSKRKKLLESVRECLREERKKNDAVSEEGRRRSSTLDRSSLPLPALPGGHQPATPEPIEEYDDEELYMDLGEPQVSHDVLTPQTSETPGNESGSGYESYGSDDDMPPRLKSIKDDDLSAVYSASNSCDVSSYIYVENKSFLSGKKLIKRIGLVREKHFQCFKKGNDTNPLLDLPLSAYNVFLSTREDTNMMMNLEAAGSGGESYRFLVHQENAAEWAFVMREQASSVSDSGSLPPPPVASRPVKTLPRTGQQQGQLHRQISMKNVTDEPRKSNAAITITSPVTHIADLSKGIKTAVSDMFRSREKYEKMKLKLSVAENMGGDLAGHLGVYCALEAKWQKKICMIREHQLEVYGKDEVPEQVINLQGCDLKPNFDDPIRKLIFSITKKNKELLVLEASSSAEMGKWVGMLIAETGCAEMPEIATEPSPPASDAEDLYVEPDYFRNVMTTAKHFFQQSKRNQKQTTDRSVAEDDGTYLEFIETSPADVKPGSPQQTGISPQSSPPVAPFRRKGKKNTHKESKACPPGNPRPDSASSSESRSAGSQSGLEIRFDFESHAGAKNSKKGTNTQSTHQPDDGNSSKNKNVMAFSVVRTTDGSDITCKQDDDDYEKEVNDSLDQLKIKRAELLKYADAGENGAAGAASSHVHLALRNTTEKIKAVEEERSRRRNKQISRPPSGNTWGYGNRSVRSGNVSEFKKMFENLDGKQS